MKSDQMACFSSEFYSIGVNLSEILMRNRLTLLLFNELYTCTVLVDGLSVFFICLGM